MTALSLAVAPLLYGAGLAKRALSIPTGGGSSPRASGPHGFNAPDGPTINISVSYHPFKKRNNLTGKPRRIHRRPCPRLQWFLRKLTTK